MILGVFWSVSTGLVFGQAFSQPTIPQPPTASIAAFVALHFLVVIGLILFIAYLRPGVQRTTLDSPQFALAVALLCFCATLLISAYLLVPARSYEVRVFTFALLVIWMIWTMIEAYPHTESEK